MDSLHKRCIQCIAFMNSSLTNNFYGLSIFSCKCLAHHFLLKALCVHRDLNVAQSNAKSNTVIWFLPLWLEANHFEFSPNLPPNHMLPYFRNIMPNCLSNGLPLTWPSPAFRRNCRSFKADSCICLTNSAIMTLMNNTLLRDFGGLISGRFGKSREQFFRSK